MTALAQLSVLFLAHSDGTGRAPCEFVVGSDFFALVCEELSHRPVPSEPSDASLRLFNTRIRSSGHSGFDVHVLTRAVHRA